MSALTDAGTGLAVLVFIGGAVIILGVGYAFRRIGRTRRELGPWSVALAFVSFLTGLNLMAYAIFAMCADASSTCVDGRSAFFRLFLAAAQAAILLLPLVFLQLPLSALFAFIPAMALVLVQLAETLFAPYRIALLTLPLVLVIEIIALRVAWGTGRVRKIDEPRDERYEHRHEAHSDDAVKKWQGPRELRDRRIYPYSTGNASDALALLGSQQYTTTPLGAIEMGASSVNAGVSTIVTPSAAIVVTTIVESILLGILGVGCNDGWLHAIMGAYAITHGVLSIATLAPASTFA